MQQLASQLQTDPDEVFQQHRKTCSLDEVFGHSGLQLNLHINSCRPNVCIPELRCFRGKGTPKVACNQQHTCCTQCTCTLDAVYAMTETNVADYMLCLPAEDKNNKQKKDLSRRSSSGNWIEDRVTWKEELNYKKAMGYM